MTSPYKTQTPKWTFLFKKCNKKIMATKNNSLNLKDWTNKKLQKEFKGYSYMIDTMECFGTKDVMMLMRIENEIIKRGGEIETIKIASFNK